MEGNYSFRELFNVDQLNHLKKEWVKSLISPQDGMWESFRENAKNWGVFDGNTMIGYAAIGEDNQLIQYYIIPNLMSKNEDIFKAFLDKMQIKTAVVGTNNPCFLSAALNYTSDVKINSYLFRDGNEVEIEDKEGTIKECQEHDLNRIVDFCHSSIGAPKGWLLEYIGDLVNRKEIYFLEHNGDIIGTCEIRKSKTAPEFADIGMIVSPKYRQQGYGTYLLHEAKRIAIEWKKVPICSCEKENIGSIKSIHKCGFVSRYQLLSMSFE